MSVHQLPDGRWICKFPPGTFPDRPTLRRRYFGRGDEAEREAWKLNNDLGFGVTRKPKTQSPLFAELATAYYQARTEIIAATTAARWAVRMKGTILPALGHLIAHQLTPAEISRYTVTRARTVKRVTIHREVSDIRAILRWSVRARLIASNPMEGYDMPRLDNARIRPPTKAEIEAILQHAAPHLRRAIFISYNCGLRPGREELLSLTWDCVDLIGKTITVTSAQKGGLEERTIPLGASFAALLGKWFDDDEKAGVRFLVHYNGAKVDSLKTAWKNAKARARITRRLRLYDIRHAFATTLLERGADLKTVSNLLGHKSPIMTISVYQHVSGDLKRKVVSLLDDVSV